MTWGGIPKVILLDATNSPQFANFITSTKNLDTHVCANFDGGFMPVGELRWSGIGIPLDIRRDQLEDQDSLAAHFGQQRPGATYVQGNEYS